MMEWILLALIFSITTDGRHCSPLGNLESSLDTYEEEKLAFF